MVVQARGEKHMKWSMRSHNGIYWGGFLLVAIGILGLAAAALTNPGSVDSASVQNLMASRPLVVVAAVLLIIIGAAMRVSVRQAQPRD